MKLRNYKYLVYGIIIGIVLCFLHNYLIHDNYIYLSQQDLIFENNITIPKNTYFVLHETMPEGFSRFKLCININKDKIDKIEFSKKKAGEWWIPYWHLNEVTYKKGK
jgi:hypothetical protein